ncbi:hypothetical protein KFL_011480010 [Klebsormidium nitens]|uniref:Uncharacterized protein n=1 Tax=Klebsormidium nitens TaxID=105231 RepID=A0A1Y1ITB6_KLENI|nr:hypothetical protein KFL_011480010 [Klebsormidium nitens]|eukprot:GAQ92809.1 hypothetical protein KFL_011480010 [Klebsormidium nitens]
MASRTIAALLGLLMVGALGREVNGARLPKQGSRDVAKPSEVISTSSRKLLQNAGSCAFVNAPSASGADGGVNPNGVLCRFFFSQISL